MLYNHFYLVLYTRNVFSNYNCIILFHPSRKFNTFLFSHNIDVYFNIIIIVYNNNYLTLDGGTVCL